MTDLYVFFGHGWNTDKTFNISHLNNTQIVMMKEPCILYECREFKHMKNIMKVGNKGYTHLDYLRELYKHTTDNYKNKFCIFDSHNNTVVPNILLTVFKKDTELVRLQKIGDVRSTKFPENVMLLSELVEYLKDNFNLIVYTCRGQLDQFQLDNIHIFGEQQGKDIINKIVTSNINVLEYKPEDLPCKDFTGKNLE